MMGSKSRSSLFKERLGKPPGHYEVLGSKEDVDESVLLRLHTYTPNDFSIGDIEDLSSIKRDLCDGQVRWLEVQGISNVVMMRSLAETFDIHPLIIEDIMNKDVKPKIEIHEESVFIVAKMPVFKDDRMVIEHFSLLLYQNMLITFHDSKESPFESIRQRMMLKDSRMRIRGADYLMYAILDNLIDHHILSVKIIEDRIDELEQEEIFEGDRLLFSLDDLKRQILLLRREALPIQRMSMELKGLESPLIDGSIDIFLNDLHDHTSYVVESLDSAREVLMEMHQLYLAITSNRMNDVMKVLTIVATIFIPLTFVAGIYGMNFTNMPELQWDLGYFFTLALMAAIGVGMGVYFHRKGWI